MLLSLLATAALAAAPKHLSLDEALAALERQNPTLARSAAQASAARAAVLIADSAVLPSLTATGGYVRNNEEVTLDLSPLFEALAAFTGQDVSSAPGPLTLQPLDAWSGTGTVRVPLIAPSAWASISAARRSADAAHAARDASVSSLRSAAYQGFWGEAAAEELVTAQDASVERARALQASAERALAAGTATRLAVLQAQTEVARREADAVSAHANLDKARIAVGALLGEDAPVMVEMPATVSATPVDPDALVANAWSGRGEVQAATLQADAARSQLLAARLGALPTVSGSFSAFASTEPYTTGKQTGWRATADLTWPLLQGGLRAGNEARAQAVLADAEAAVAAAKLQVAQQVRSASIDLAVAAQRADLTHRQHELAAEAARVAQRSFDAGTLGAKDVLDALDRLDLAEAAAVDAKARVGIADAALKAATGRW